MFPTPRLLASASVTFALLACSSPYSIPQPSSDGTVVGGGSSEQPAPTTPDAGPTVPSQGGGGSADAGSPVQPDAATAVDSGGAAEAGAPAVEAGPPQQPTPPAQGPLGSCTNPVCGTDLNECGCQATDSSGNTVQMGCQAGGQCVCVLNNATTDPPFDENGACGAQASTVQQFLTSCTCQ